MAINPVDTGTAPDNKTGDNLRLGGQKINANFEYLDQASKDLAIAIQENGLEIASKLPKGTYTTGTAGDLKAEIDANGLELASHETRIGEIEVNVDDWNEAFAKNTVSVSFTGDNNKTLTLTRQDGTILTASFIDNDDGTGTVTDDVLNSWEFNINNDGVLQATTREGIILNVNLDGRYSLIGHGHSATEISETTERRFVSDTEKEVWNGKQDAQRSVKEIPNTSQYTLATADFTDHILDFTANEGETIQVILNAGVAPAGGQIQAISSGNNFLVPTAGTGITLLRPEGTNAKTTSKGWLGIVPLSASNTFGINGNLESTEEGAQTYNVFTASEEGLVPAGGSGSTKYLRQDGQWIVPDGKTYSVFDNDSNGLVPAPNVSATGYTVSAGFPAEGDVLTEGESITLTSVVATGTPGKKVLKSAGWEDETPIVNITEIPNRSYNDLQDLPNISDKLDKTAKIQAMWSGTQAEYDAIGTKSATTLYFIQ